MVHLCGDMGRAGPQTRCLLSPITSVVPTHCSREAGGTSSDAPFVCPSGQERARALWQLRFPDVPYDLDMTQPLPAHETALKYDLVKAITRHADGLMQVSCPHFRDPEFLQESIQRYYRHLALKVRYKDAVVLPTVDVAFLWKAHQLHPLRYRSDMDEFVGYSPMRLTFAREWKRSVGKEGGGQEEWAREGEGGMETTQQMENQAIHAPALRTSPVQRCIMCTHLCPRSLLSTTAPAPTYSSPSFQTIR